MSPIWVLWKKNPVGLLLFVMYLMFLCGCSVVTHWGQMRSVETSWLQAALLGSPLLLLLLSVSMLWTQSAPGKGDVAWGWCGVAFMQWLWGSTFVTNWKYNFHCWLLLFNRCTFSYLNWVFVFMANVNYISSRHGSLLNRVICHDFYWGDWWETIPCVNHGYEFDTQWLSIWCPNAGPTSLPAKGCGFQRDQLSLLRPGEFCHAITWRMQGVLKFIWWIFGKSSMPINH